MEFSIKADTRRFEAMNDEVRRQLPYATSLAVNNVAKRIREEEKRQMARVFDNPTPFTLRSVLIEWANKRKPWGRVFIRDEAFKGTAPVKYMGPEVYGEQRRTKRFERSLIHKGIMPAGMYVVPGSGAKLNRYGNITPGTFTQILSALGANADWMQNRTGSRRSNRNARGKAYFVAKIKGVLGVWQRYGAGGRSAKPILIFTRNKPDYKTKFPFHRISAGVSKAT